MNPPPRWGALTYSSYDDGAKRGGWQVKETRGELSDDEEKRLCAQMVTSLDLALPLPSFPTPADIAALPPRLVYSPGADGVARYWHTVFAGPDATGRPGNVFVHALVDRMPRGRPRVRPAELWRSPDWLCPYGADDVRAASLGATAAVNPGTAADRARVLDFLLDPAEWRVGVLCALLDAISAASRDGRRIVLGTASADEAALWTAAVGQLTSPVLAGGLGFSTFERAATVAAAVARGDQLIAVPVDDLAVLPADIPDLVVIDSGETVTLGILGDTPHGTAAGSRIVVTRWSVLAESALADRDAAEGVLERLDTISGSLDTIGCDVAWPLAAALAMSGEEFADLADAIGAALIGSAPADLANHAELAARVDDELARRVGKTAASVWTAVAAAGPESSPLTARSYLRLAIRDASWLAAPGGAPIPPTLPEPDAATQAIFDREVAARANGDEVPRGPDAARAALQLVEFGVRCGLVVEPVTGRLPEQLAAVITGVIVPELAAREGAAVVSGVPSIRPGAVMMLLQQSLDELIGEQQPGNPLCGLWVDADVLQWLRPNGMSQLGVDDLAEGRIDAFRVSPTAVALVVNEARAAVAAGWHDSPRAGASLWFALCAATINPHAVYLGLVDELAVLYLSAWELTHMVRRFGAMVPALPLLQRFDDAPPLDTEVLAEAVENMDDRDARWPAGHADALRAYARLRLVVAAGRGPTADAYRRVLAAVDAVAPTDLDRVLHGEYASIFAAVVAALVLADTTAVLERADRPAASTYVSGMLLERDAGSGWGPREVRPMPAGRHAVSDPPSTAEMPLPEAVALVRRFAGRIEQAAVQRQLRRCFDHRLFDAAALIATAVLSANGSPAKGWVVFAVTTDLDRFPIDSPDSYLVEQFTLSLLRDEVFDVDSKEVVAVVDAMGRAQYGRTRWDQRTDLRDELSKLARREWKEIVADVEAERGSRGLLRRGR